MMNYQLRRDLSDDKNEIINNHLLLDNKTIIFRKDKLGASLKEFLTNENASAIIIHANGSILRSYGVFAYDDPDHREYYRLLSPIVKNVEKTKKLAELSLTWNKQNFQSMVIPLRSNNITVGALILAKSTSDLFGFRQTMVTVFSMLGFLSLIGSFAVGYFLARRTLTPLIQLAGIVEEMNLDKLETTLNVKGHPQDELVLLVQKFNEMIIRLKDMTKRQKEFIANASHELRTPLTRAISSLEILDTTDPHNKNEIELIKQDLFYINTLLEKLLILAKATKDTYLLSRPEIISFRTLFDVLQKNFADQLRNNKITLVGNFPESIRTHVPKEYLAMILANLISNAIKYSPQNTHIHLSVLESGKETIIQIKDEGIGMSDTEVNRIFSRYFRGTSNMNYEKGYGIGLAIVKQICDLYHVYISVKSEKGKGTKITLSLKNTD